MGKALRNRRVTILVQMEDAEELLAEAIQEGEEQDDGSET